MKRKELEKKITDLEQCIVGQTAALVNLKDELFDTYQYRQLSKMIGKCFKYRNRYSGDDSWWMYQAVKSVETEHSFKGVRFQTDCYGKTDFDPDAYITSNTLGEPCTKKEFNRELKKIINKIAKAEGR